MKNPTPIYLVIAIKIDAHKLTDYHSGYNEMTTHKVQQLPLNHQYQYGT